MRQFKMSVDPLAACVRHSDGTVFPGSLSTSLSNVVLSAIPSNIQHLVEAFLEFYTTSKRMPPPRRPLATTGVLLQKVGQRSDVL